MYLYLLQLLFFGTLTIVNDHIFTEGSASHICNFYKPRNDPNIKIIGIELHQKFKFYVTSIRYHY